MTPGKLDEIIAETDAVSKKLLASVYPPVLGVPQEITAAILEVAAKLPLAEVPGYLAVYQQAKAHLPIQYQDLLIRVAYDLYRRANGPTA